MGKRMDADAMSFREGSGDDIQVFRKTSRDEKSRVNPAVLQDIQQIGGVGTRTIVKGQIDGRTFLCRYFGRGKNAAGTGDVT